MTDLPAKPLPPDAVDMAARAVALEVAEHIATMYPDAAKAVAWESCKRSVSGVIRNAMIRLGRAAEHGRLEDEIRLMAKQRRDIRAAAGKAMNALSERGDRT